jgi:hypothetical protein
MQKFRLWYPGLRGCGVSKGPTANVFGVAVTLAVAFSFRALVITYKNKQCHIPADHNVHMTVNDCFCVPICSAAVCRVIQQMFKRSLNDLDDGILQ